MIASLSGIRGILNTDLTLEDVAHFAGNFAREAESDEIFMARDTRSTGPAIGRAVAAAAMSRGLKVLDYGVISTPALFRESRVSGRPAVMVTASHNEPEFNGLKFIVEGRGIAKQTFDAVTGPFLGQLGGFGAGTTRRVPNPTYVEDLVQRFGTGCCEGVRVALDLGGGAAISHATTLLGRLGCEVDTVNDAAGVFSRRIDPVADDLSVLRRLVRERGCDIGLGFDCDGDRLVIVDAAGRKRSGDFMLAFAISELLEETGEKKVVVSLDTTQAIDDVVRKAGGRVFRSKVGESNVVGVMSDVGARLGGEGSSGGLIDGEFNYCRDSMLAAIVIIRALRQKGRGAYESVPVYHQERVAVSVSKSKAQKAFKTLASKYRDADMTDGVKIMLPGRSWVLMRASGTEDLVRVSAEAETAWEALKNAKTFASKLMELSR
ncbi:MAG: phosphomannomutase [Nitrososphaerales archaeon]